MKNEPLKQVATTKKMKNTRRSRSRRSAAVEDALIKFINAFLALKKLPPHTEDNKEAHKRWERHSALLTAPRTR